MKKSLCLGTFLAITSTGCTGLYNTDAGATTGGVFGGITRARRRALTGRPLAGAAPCGAGALAGGAIGNSVDRSQGRQDQAAVTQAQKNMLTVNDVVQLTQSGTQKQIIINQINATNSVFSRRCRDLTYLQQQGVSPRVIATMQSRYASAYVPVAQPAAGGHGCRAAASAAGGIWRRGGWAVSAPEKSEEAKPPSGCQDACLWDKIHRHASSRALGGLLTFRLLMPASPLWKPRASRKSGCRLALGLRRGLAGIRFLKSNSLFTPGGQTRPR